MRNNTYPYTSRYAARRPSLAEMKRLGTFDASEPAFMSYNPGKEPVLRPVGRQESIDLGKLIARATSSC